MSSIPEEIYNEILIKLPVESLLVCKCVCRNWYALITSSDFVKSHLHLTTQKNDNTLLLQCGGIYSIAYDLLASPVCEFENDATEITHPFKSLDYSVQLLGSCNGLVWIWLFDNDKDFLCLWNPATREYKKIPPKTPIEFDLSSFRLHGCGYDHKTDDYKLVIGEEDPESEDSTIVQVYSLTSNSWKAEKNMPYSNPDGNEQNSGVFVNGHLHWLVLGPDDFLLLTLDINDESFKEMQLSKELLEVIKDPLMVLGVLKGCLCILVNSYVRGVNIHSEIWEMSDYGAQESWVKRHIITHESILTIRDREDSSMMWSFENGKILFLASVSLLLYDTEHGSARELNIRHMRYIVRYFESLVPLNSGTYLGGEERIEGVQET